MDNQLFQYVVRAIVLLTAIPIHESAHALVADKLGDPTAKYQGRISLNPMVHFDLFGSLCMIFAGIGWAKPVPINTYNFKGDRRVGMAISAAAGPVSNLIIAYISIVILKIIGNVGAIEGSFLSTIFYIFYYMARINIMLTVFNLIPVPPFDGSRIFNLILPENYYFKIMQYERYIFFGIFFVLMTGVLDGPLAFFNNIVYNALSFLAGYVDVIFGLFR